MRPCLPLRAWLHSCPSRAPGLSADRRDSIISIPSRHRANTTAGSHWRCMHPDRYCQTFHCFVHREYRHCRTRTLQHRYYDPGREPPCCLNSSSQARSLYLLDCGHNYTSAPAPARLDPREDRVGSMKSLEGWSLDSHSRMSDMRHRTV